MTIRVLLYAVLLSLTFLMQAVAQQTDQRDAFSAETASGEQTIVQMEGPSPIDQRLDLERQTRLNPFALTPHKQNYILLAAYNRTPNHASNQDIGGELDKTEIKFQISFKTALKENLFGENGHLYFGYTQQSYWQAYNWTYSAPFRESNYEPEFMLYFLTDAEILGWKNRITTFGIVHQSNGRGGDFSRSWNRLYADFILVRGNFSLSIKPWYRIRESAATDNNPDIQKYLGYGEVLAVYHKGNREYAILLRDNLRRDHNRGAVQIEWSFPLENKLKGYVQYFNGYGESLIDYDHSCSRISAGLMLSGWL